MRGALLKNEIDSLLLSKSFQSVGLTEQMNGDHTLSFLYHDEISVITHLDKAMSDFWYS